MSKEFVGGFYLVRAVLILAFALPSASDSLSNSGAMSVRKNPKYLSHLIIDHEQIREEYVECFNILDTNVDNYDTDICKRSIILLNNVLTEYNMAPLRLEDVWLLHYILESIVEHNLENGR